MKLRDHFEIKSLALLSDLIPAQYESRICCHPDCISIHTPDQPDYFWGNFLAFKHPPAGKSLTRWKNRYKEIFKKTEPRFYTFTWDIGEYNSENIKPFIEEGFDFSSDSTLVTSKPVIPSGFNPEVTVEPIIFERHWELIPDVHYNPDRPSSYESQTAFIKKRINSFRKLSEKKIGHRFGAFIGDRLVGDLGIYHQDGIARFNEVATHHEFYRKGICQTLVYRSSVYALQNFGARQLVIVADDAYHAVNAYKKVGFSEYETNHSLQWYNKDVYGRI